MRTRSETKTPEETLSAGESLGRTLTGGEVVLLEGGLGSGKTVFTKGIARGLDIEDVVTSPSFAIMNRYEGRLRLCHFDFYRLDRPGEMEDLLEDCIYHEDTVVVIEWGEALGGLLESPLRVRFEIEEEGRVITVERGGA